MLIIGMTFAKIAHPNGRKDQLEDRYLGMAEASSLTNVHSSSIDSFRRSGPCYQTVHLLGGFWLGTSTKFSFSTPSPLTFYLIRLCIMKFIDLI